MSCFDVVDIVSAFGVSALGLPIAQSVLRVSCRE
jgi:hypothetical protein